MRIEDEINRLPDELSWEDEQKLLRSKTTDSRDKLLQHTLKSATRFATTVVRGRIPLDEVFSLVSYALLLAIPKYRQRRGQRAVRLLTYAKAYIRREVAQAWRARSPVNYKSHPPEENLTVAFSYYEELSETVDEGPDFDQIDLNEKWQLVEPHLKRLSETERRVLILLYDARLSGPEIGRMLGFTRANVREARNRAFRKIRKALYCEGKLYL
jgi:RNA polymerase sigma factor (sigma-70 family)